MTIAITGGSGFLGRHLSNTLAKQGHIVHLIEHEYLIEKVDQLENRLKEINPEWIFHLAAFGNMAHQKDEFDIFSANLAGTFNLLQSTKDIEYKAFVNVSTSSVTLPHQTLYSATKMGAEYLCKAYSDELEKPIVSIRPYSIYGEYEADFRFIPTVFRSCMMGEAMKLDPIAYHDWIHAQDVVDVLIASAENINHFRGRSLEAGTGISTSNTTIVNIIQEITGKKANIIDHTRLRAFDNDKWKANISVPHRSLQEGLQQYYDFINQSTENN